MAKQEIFVFGFITMAVFIQIKGNSFKKLFSITKLNNTSVSNAETVSHSEEFAKGKYSSCRMLGHR